MEKYRYPGSNSFTAEDSALFFGREREKKELFRLIVLNNIVVLFGKSGTGKTSLLQAGVGPLLQNTRLKPVRIRLNQPKIRINQQIYEQLNDGEYLPVGVSNESTLQEYCYRFEYVLDGESYAPVLIFDQFEELFTLYQDNSAEHSKFFDELADVLSQVNAPSGNTNFRKIHIVISIRSDFLFLLDRISVKIPSILRCRYELSALNDSNARLAIIEPASKSKTADGIPFKSPTFSYSEASLKEIIASLSAADQVGRMEVEAFQLQLVCHRIENQVIDSNKPAKFIVTPQFYGGSGGIANIREAFYKGILEKFPADRMSFIQTMVEDKLLSNNRRILQERGFLMKESKVKAEELDVLTRHRLLREEPRGSSYYVEISHDALVEPIAKIRTEREIVKARIAAEKKFWRLLIGILVVIGVVIISAIFYQRWTYSKKQREEEALKAVVKTRKDRIQNQINNDKDYFEKAAQLNQLFLVKIDSLERNNEPAANILKLIDEHLSKLEQ
ncbi:MAG: ATP-binding protein [Saprospiraceae bacterium]|nr:ATP-binding protein [Saprospiraceae bacterium]